MKSVLVVLLALGAVGVGALIHALLASSPTPVETAAAPAPDAGVSRRLERMETRLDEVVEALAALREKGAATRSAPSPAATDPTLQGAPGAASRAGPRPPPTLPHPESFTGRTNEELSNEAEDLARGGKDPAAALRRWRELLDRDLPEHEHLAALMGMARTLKDLGHVDTAKETLQRVIDEAPADDGYKDIARLHLGGMSFERGDYEASLAAADTVIGSGGAAEFQVVNARWLRVTSLIKLGDEGSARQELESMLRDYAGREGMEPLLRMYRSQLARLE